MGISEKVYTVIGPPSISEVVHREFSILLFIKRYKAELTSAIIFYGTLSSSAAFSVARDSTHFTCHFPLNIEKRSQCFKRRTSARFAAESRQRVVADDGYPSIPLLLYTLITLARVHFTFYQLEGVAPKAKRRCLLV